MKAWDLYMIFFLDTATPGVYLIYKKNIIEYIFSLIQNTL